MLFRLHLTATYLLFFSLIVDALSLIRPSQMQFALCASVEGRDLRTIVTRNLERFAALYNGDKRVVTLQVDEIATEQRARYSGLTDEVRM